MIRSKDSENLTRDNLKKVVELLSAEKPITKKAACELLNISYNTARLDKIIEDFKAKEVFRKEQRAKKRGKPFTPDEYNLIATAYLADGSSLDAIAERLYRSTDSVKDAIQQMALPQRQKSYSYFKPQLIPDDAVQEQFDIGEVVWSTRYESIAEVMDLVQIHESLGYVYRIWLKDEKWQQYAYQPAYELASLKHLTKFGVSL